ncbi:MAG: RnfABCDGE type electron transport complex subunit G [Alphaproteobacteria bacterium]
MKKNVKIIFSLVFITSVCAALLAFVYEKTLNPIKNAEDDLYLEMITDVLPLDFDNNPYAEKIVLRGDNKREFLELYPAKKGEKIVGVAVKTYSKKGYGGQLNLIVGFFVDGRINKFKLLSNKETPGLGTKVEEDKFMGALNGFNPRYGDLRVTQDGGDIDAVSAATISSRAVLEAIEKAYSVYQTYKGEH